MPQGEVMKYLMWDGPYMHFCGSYFERWSWSGTTPAKTWSVAIMEEMLKLGRQEGMTRMVGKDGLRRVPLTWWTPSLAVGAGS